jgi:transposase
VVICVDAKTQVQALDRTQPVFPLLPGTPGRRSPDYVRHGTIDLYAALNLTTGMVIHQLTNRHRAIEFRKFLNAIDTAVPTDLEIHVVLDNSSTHKTPEIHRWLLRHPRFHFHFTPTLSSWMNLVERWFAEITNKWLRRGMHRSVKELAASITHWVGTWNEDPSHMCGTRPLTRYSKASRHIVNESWNRDTRRHLVHDSWSLENRGAERDEAHAEHLAAPNRPPRRISARTFCR